MLPSEADYDTPHFGIGSNFAMVFQDDDGTLYWLCGRVQRMVHVSGRKRTMWRRPVPFTNEERPKVEIYAKWYSRQRGSLRFKYDVNDSNPFLFENVLALVDLERESSEDYGMSAETRDHLGSLTKSLDESNAPGASAYSVARQADRREDELGNGAAGTQVHFQAAGTSRGGRQVTARVTSESAVGGSSAAASAAGKAATSSKPSSKQSKKKRKRKGNR